MRTQRVGALVNGRADGRRPRRARHRGDAGWQSHTFSDGLRSITLTSELDTGTADRLRERLRELSERGCERLIVDVTAVVQPGKQAPALLGAVLQAHARSCEVVVVTPRGSMLDWSLPARVAVAWSLSDARRLLALDPGAGTSRERPAPAGAISPGDRHTLAIRQALRWAAQRAGAGDYEDALRGLATIERVEGALPDDWQNRRQAWLLASREQIKRPRQRGMSRPPGLGAAGHEQPPSR